MIIGFRSIDPNRIIIKVWLVSYVLKTINLRRPIGITMKYNIITDVWRAGSKRTLVDASRFIVE